MNFLLSNLIEYTICMIIGGFFIFILGLIFGSFLNAWEYRIENKMSLGGRSICPKCKNKIIWYDNIPLLSWIVLRGRCRHCHKSISIQYPSVELITGLTFLGLWLFTPSGIALNNYLLSITNFQYANLQFPIKELIIFVFCILYFVLLLLVAIYDAKTKYVLSKCAYATGAIGLLYNAFSSGNTFLSWNNLYPYLLAVIIPTGIFWLIAKISKERAMGYGDAEIALAIGLLLGGPRVIPAYYFAFIVGAIYGIFVLIRKKGTLKSEVPLGPFLISGSLFGFLFGQQIFDWYLHLIGVM